MKSWVKELRKMLGSEIALCIAGNKIDLEKNRTVDREEAIAYAAQRAAAARDATPRLTPAPRQVRPIGGRTAL